MGLGLAFRAFFAGLGGGERAERLAQALRGADRPAIAPPPAAPAPAPAAPAKPPRPVRSEAVTLLATLQREARFLDLVQEPLEQYQDAQIGAAARDVLRDCRKVLQRLFSIEPLVEQGEGATIELPQHPSPLRYRVVGSSGAATGRGQVVHPGWRAQHCQLPEWTGTAEDALVIAPAEIEAAR